MAGIDGVGALGASGTVRVQLPEILRWRRVKKIEHALVDLGPLGARDRGDDDRVRQAAEAFCQLSQMENPFPHGLLSLNVEPAVKCRDKNLRGHDSGCRKVSALSAREFSVVHFAENANVVVLLKVWPGRRIVEGNSGRWTESG